MPVNGQKVYIKCMKQIIVINDVILRILETNHITIKLCLSSIAFYFDIYVHNLHDRLKY
jgi:hypothetical protein